MESLIRKKWDDLLNDLIEFNVADCYDYLDEDDE